MEACQPLLDRYVFDVVHRVVVVENPGPDGSEGQGVRLQFHFDLAIRLQQWHFEMRAADAIVRIVA